MDGMFQSSDDAELTTAAGETFLRETAVLKNFFTVKSTGKLWIQTVEVEVENIENRIHDVILTCWGKSSQRDDLVFVMTQDENSGVLATIEGLSNYVALTLSEASADYQRICREARA